MGNITIWGNHSSTQFPDPFHATVKVYQERTDKRQRQTRTDRQTDKDRQTEKGKQTVKDIQTDKGRGTDKERHPFLTGTSRDDRWCGHHRQIFMTHNYRNLLFSNYFDKAKLIIGATENDGIFAGQGCVHSGLFLNVKNVT